MALTTREKWILAAAPGLLTGFVYFFHTGKPAQLKSTAAIADLEKERAKPFDIRALQSLRDDLDKNEAAIEHAKDDSKLLSGAQAALLGPESEDRSGALHVISKAVEARGMKLSSSERIDVGADAGLPARALAAWKPYAEKHHSPAPQIWRVIVRGSYPKMQEVCNDLLHAEVFVAPLSISMERPASGDPRGPELFWTLTVWL